MAKPIPEGLHTITPQLTIDGADDAIAFYQRAFGAEEVMRAPDPSGKKIWHAELRIGSSTIFLNDAFPEMGGPAHPTKLWLYTPGVDQAFKRAVEAGAKVTMPVTDMFWGDRTGAVADRWGNVWNLAEHTRDLTPEQMKKEEAALVAQMKAAPAK